MMNIKINTENIEILKSISLTELLSESLLQFNFKVEDIKSEHTVGLVFRIKNVKNTDCLFNSTQKKTDLFTNIGLCSFSIFREKLYILKLGVLPEFRLMGIGTFIINYIKNKYDKYKISLHTPVNNYPAIMFYEKNGFVFRSKIKNYYWCGYYLDACYMVYK
ncbi:N-alpha-acetyltransferase 50 [Dictyocoela muelleri]|nr:N-alpha-acetyltransferase 50 [Dictyocoela muelleri]